MSAFLASTAGKLLFYALIAGLATGGYFYWQHVVASRAIAEAQVKALAELQQRQAETIAERNRIWAQMLALPDGRVRLCAIRGPSSPCCKPVGECAP